MQLCMFVEAIWWRKSHNLDKNDTEQMYICNVHLAATNHFIQPVREESRSAAEEEDVRV